MSASEYARPTCSAWTKAREFTASLGSEIKCPACGTFGSTMNILKTCAGCGAPWRKAKRGGYEFLCRPNAEAHGRAVARTVQPLVGSSDTEGK